MKKIILLIMFRTLFSSHDIEVIDNNTILSNTSTSIKNIINFRNNKHNLSFGLFDSRIGNTFICYNHDIFQNNNRNNELFIGFGTALITTNLSLGYKQYFTTAKRSIFSVMSLHLSAVTLDPDWDKPNQIGVYPTIASGLERVFKKYSIQYGLFFAYMKTSYGYEYGLIPFINIDYRF